MHSARGNETREPIWEVLNSGIQYLFAKAKLVCVILSSHDLHKSIKRAFFAIIITQLNIVVAENMHQDNLELSRSKVSSRTGVTTVA